NSGFGGFTRALDALPELATTGAVVTGDDWDGDGDTDLFVGGHVHPGRYPLPERSYLLENVGGTFADATERAAPDLMAPGLVGDALWADLDGDSSAELVVAGEWMPIRVFQPTDGGSFAEVTSAFGFDGTTGWWRSLLAHDLDGDGDLDLLAGNRGLNTQMPAPATLHAADFDANGQMESVMSYVWDGAAYPVPNRDELLRAIPFLGNRFPTYASYAIATSDSLLPAAIWNDALVLDAQTFATTVFANNSDGTFAARPLPSKAQLAPVFATLALDADRDGTTDLLLAGNDSSVRAQWGREQAGQGLWLRGQDALSFTPKPSPESGLFLPDDVRDMQLVRTSNGTVVVAATNDAALQVFGIR
ncbi:MAG: FG-GAP-like repeat-containing protein, partial [Bacteroidota bacterium]